MVDNLLLVYKAYMLLSIARPYSLRVFFESLDYIFSLSKITQEKSTLFLRKYIIDHITLENSARSQEILSPSISTLEAEVFAPVSETDTPETSRSIPETELETELETETSEASSSIPESETVTSETSRHVSDTQGLYPNLLN